MPKINDGWAFAKDQPSRFIPIDIPHDWLISDTQRLYETGIGWYTRNIDASTLKEGQRMFIRFDGVYMNSTVYVNGLEVGCWKYGYTAFEFDITEYIERGPVNTLLLKVEYESPSERWYTGAGIYRDVYLFVKNPCRFISDGIYISTGFTEKSWYFEVESQVETGGQDYEIRHTLFDGEKPVPGIEVDGNRYRIVGSEIEPWHPNRPRTYTLYSELLVDGVAADQEETGIGFRTFKLTPDRGLFLNGEYFKLFGVCLHHDLGLLGAAVHPDAIRRQLTTLKQMGVNAIRTAHNPPAKVFMDLADEMGFIVVSELLDMWRIPKNPYDYARFFDEWIQKDVASWIRRDRNHASVLLWSVGNEIPDTHIDPDLAAETLQGLITLVKTHDPRGNASPTLCSNYMPWKNTQGCADLVKIVGYNYGESLYEEHHALHPDWIIFGSETCSTVQSRGVYRFPLSRSILADDDQQCSALGNSATSWGAKNVETCILKDLAVPYSLGQFIWAGQDYLGEPTPYHTKNSYLGHIDTAGFPKDSYYLFQAGWIKHTERPMVHVFPYWDFSLGQTIDVRVCSNAPEVALYLDEEHLGTVKLNGQIVADWQVPYRPGTLRAIALDETGNIVAESVRASFGEADSLRVDYEEFGELLFATVTALDARGNPVENANRRVRISIENGTLLGLDNGDSTDYEQYRSECRRLFNGRLLALVKPVSETLVPRILAEFDSSDIPIRKIELHAEGYRVMARIFPENASYTDLSWRLTDAGGIDSPLGLLKITDDPPGVTVIPRGDGQVFVRCSSTNGRGFPSVISQLDLKISGVGKFFLDPYSMVSGGLYTNSNIELTNGNERGVATVRDGESHVGFRDLDFGSYGSDELNIFLFPLDTDPFTFEIWEGMPQQGGSRLCEQRYDKGSVWNTYKDMLCRLPRRLCGVTTLCFVFRRKVHIKGFIFTRYQKAYQRLPAAECDQIYGDSYLRTDRGVEKIGNNVTLVFEDMDFGSQGARRVVVCWRTELVKNPIHFLFSDSEKGGQPGDEAGEIRRMIEAGKSEHLTEAEFDLGEPITGQRVVSVVFLPGSSLDLAWIQFKE